MQVFEYLRGLKRKYDFIGRNNTEPSNPGVDNNLGNQLNITDGGVEKQIPAKVMKASNKEAQKFTTGKIKKRA